MEATETADRKAKAGGPFEFGVNVYAWFSHHDDPRDWDDGKHRNKLSALSRSDASRGIVKAVEAILTACGAVRTSRTLPYSGPPAKASPKGNSSFFIVAWTSPVQLAGQIQALFDAIQLLAGACYWDGREAGEKMLLGAASGELSLDDVQNHMLETERRRLARR